ncbi:hypothetical protein K461DRAFT_298368 [Myriangium duriaei CBS 260.36]|uniref:Uncharacterized protein n=1 Tax=Myriangium duriaei CBS 260.36 TaxID=1168546 RepID=A0A9P4ISZ1_9PEZI|nr:hypothetical protein K461DRAFT_298368 [Myriangium duriaei CBS 260.36]
MLSITFPESTYDKPLFVWAKEYRRFKQLGQLPQQSPPLQTLGRMADLDGIPMNLHGLIVGFVPVDFKSLGLEASREARSPYREWFMHSRARRMEDYCSASWTTLKFNQNVALVVARWQNMHIPYERRKREVVYDVLLDADSQGILTGYCIAKHDVFWLPQYRNDLVSAGSMADRSADIIRDILKEHYERLLEGGERWQWQSPLATSRGIIPSSSITPMAGTDSRMAGSQPTLGRPEIGEVYDSRTSAQKQLFHDIMSQVNHAVKSGDFKSIIAYAKDVLKPILDYNKDLAGKQREQSHVDSHKGHGGHSSIGCNLDQAEQSTGTAQSNTTAGSASTAQADDSDCVVISHKRRRIEICDLLDS